MTVSVCVCLDWTTSRILCIYVYVHVLAYAHVHVHVERSPRTRSVVGSNPTQGSFFFEKRESCSGCIYLPCFDLSCTCILLAPSLSPSLPLSLSSLSPQHMDMEEDTKSLKGQLLGVCSSLEQLPSLDPLLSIWQGVCVRMFMHYQLSARAYFTFLKLSGTQSGHAPGTLSHCSLIQHALLHISIVEYDL